VTTPRMSSVINGGIYTRLARINFGVYDDCGRVIEGLVVARKILSGDGDEKHLSPLIYTLRNHGYWSSYELNGKKEWSPVYRSERPELFQWLCDCEEEHPAPLPSPQHLQEYRYSYQNRNGDYFALGAQILLPPLGFAGLIVAEAKPGGSPHPNDRKKYIYTPRAGGEWDRWKWNSAEGAYQSSPLLVNKDKKESLYEVLALAWGAFVGTKLATEPDPDPTPAPDPDPAPPSPQDSLIIRDIVANTVCALEQTLSDHAANLKHGPTQAAILLDLTEYLEGRARSMRIHAHALLRGYGVKQ